MDFFSPGSRPLLGNITCKRGSLNHCVRACGDKLSEAKLRPKTRRADSGAGRGMRVSRLPRGKARIVRGFCDFAVGVTILLYAAPFRAIWSADWRVLGADYGADRRADFPCVALGMSVRIEQ